MVFCTCTTGTGILELVLVLELELVFGNGIDICHHELSTLVASSSYLVEAATTLWLL